MRLHDTRLVFTPIGDLSDALDEYDEQRNQVESDFDSLSEQIKELAHIFRERLLPVLTPEALKELSEEEVWELNQDLHEAIRDVTEWSDEVTRDLSDANPAWQLVELHLDRAKE